MQRFFIQSQDRQGSCYHEFYQGTWDRKKMVFWHKESICISDYNFNMTGLAKLIAEIIPEYDPYGMTIVTRKDWDMIAERAAATGGELADAVTEANEWTKQNFRRHKVFTILGL